MSEIMKRAYADRAEYLGDPGHINIPVKALTSKAYASALVQQISGQGDTVN
jgi:gamma-glutamyltranspeptidase/glutathione hydrolase